MKIYMLSKYLKKTAAVMSSVMIFSFVTMNLKGRDRKYAAFDQIAL